MFNKIKFDLKVIIVILIYECKYFTLIRWRRLPTLSSLAAAQPGSSVQQLIQLNYTHFIFAFVKLKDKYYFSLIKQCITLKSDIILLNTFLNQTYILTVLNLNEKASKVILFWKINCFLNSKTQGSIHRDLIKK